MINKEIEYINSLNYSEITNSELNKFINLTRHKALQPIVKRSCWV